MKLKLITLAIAFAATSTSTMAAEKEGFYIGAFGDYYDASWKNMSAQADQDVNESVSLGAEAGYRFNDYWTARLEYADMDFNAFNSNTGSRQGIDGKRYGIDGLYHFDGGPFYGLFGLKEMDVVENNTFANLGAGYQHYFDDNLFVSAEAAVYQGLDKGYTDVGAKLGINYFFGETTTEEKVMPAPTVVEVPVAPADSDNDNIPDADDKCPNTPMTDAVDGSGCTLYQDQEVTVSLLVQFPNNDSSVSTQYFDDIEKVSEFLSKFPEASVLLEGHTSAVGKASYNKWLSKKRADAVAKQLVKDGIAEDRITTVGLGEERLKNPANTAAANKENRRVEAHVTSIKKVKVQR
ncbi:OmpA family protein [Pseudoalteromonas sp. MMG010]|uniref:OmpA family protein n=1 Tax=Pseudoalteromonas sp. MMG010 TaxID=2822685 RepID=UPI001B3A6645|nr:OmpA family protein [Pseudoalteromonas sp. MMG010]MBQ4834620.1 OmpA family protein [Pseudoalteromonas sp. MMG010]